MARRKERLALTLAALALGGAIAIAVLSVWASLLATLEQASHYWRQDITLIFDQPRRVEEVLQAIEQTPGVAGVENQPAQLAVRKQPDGSDAEQPSAFFGIRPGSDLIQPTLVQGRWLTAQDVDAAVVNVAFLKHEPDVRLGDWITLTINDRKTRWNIVGVTTAQLLNFRDSAPDQGVIYANLDAFNQSLRMVGRTNRVLIVTTQHDAAFQQQITISIENRLTSAGVQIVSQTRAALREQVAGLVSAIVLFLLVMACTFAVVAGLSLMGAMSLSVLDRTKEIGVLRAIGSSSMTMLRIVLTEGVYIGVLSWLLATLLAAPLSKVISDILGWSIVNWPLVYTFPPAAVLLWLAIVIGIAAGASYLPAASAAQLSVRDVLAYEG